MQQIHDAMQEDYEAYKCPHNPFISVDVSGPFWNNEGGVAGKHRLYKLVAKMRENPEFPCIQVHRRYSDLEWLIQALQARYPACLIPAIPPKVQGSAYYADDSEVITDRKEGIQLFLDSLIAHKLLCGSEDLNSFLTGQDHEFEAVRAATNLYINKDALNIALSNVLSDGSHAFEEISNDKTYLGQGVQMAKKATK